MIFSVGLSAWLQLALFLLYTRDISLILSYFYFFFQEGAEKQAQLERSLREKSAVEKELEKVSSTFTAPILMTLSQSSHMSPL